MQIKRRVFSYPVLNNVPSLSSYNNKIFLLKFELTDDDSDLIIKDIRYECDSDYINQKISNGDIKVICVVECSDTIYRKKFELNSSEGNNLRISKNDLSEKTDISCFAYACGDLLMETSEEFDEDYQNINYEIEKYNILCANDGYNFRIVHEQNEDNLAKSIFSIIPIDADDVDTFEVDVKTNKIEISLSQEDYQHYSNVYSSDILTEEFFCILLIPALTEGLYICKEYNEAQDIEDLEAQFHWFRSITYAYKNLYGIDLDLDEFKKMSPSSLAQRLLGSPIGKALITLENSQNGINGGDDNE